MKKLLIFTTALLISFSAFSQDKKIKVGVFGALPIGDTKEVSKTGFGLEGSYLFAISDKFDVGFTTGVSFFGGKKATTTQGGYKISYKYEDSKYVPLTGAVRFNATDKLYIGADIGYAIGLGTGVDGGFHYKPRVGYQISELIGINTSFTGLKVKGGTWNTVNIGIEFNL